MIKNDMDIFGLVWICDVCILNKCFANGVHVIYIYVILIGYGTSYVMSSFPRFFVSLFLFPSFLCFLVSSFPRFFVSSFLGFLVSSFLRFFVFLCFLIFRFFVSLFPRFFVFLFPRFFISSFPRAHWRAPGPRLEVQFPCVFSWFWNILFLILLVFFFDPLNIFFWSS